MFVCLLFGGGVCGWCNNNGESQFGVEVGVGVFRYDMLVTAVKANQACKGQRQNLSLLRSTPIGKHIEPEIAKDAAIALIDCFHHLYLPHHPANSTPPKPTAAAPLSSASALEAAARRRSTPT